MDIKQKVVIPKPQRQSISFAVEKSKYSTTEKGSTLYDDFSEQKSLLLNGYNAMLFEIERLMNVIVERSKSYDLKVENTTDDVIVKALFYNVFNGEKKTITFEDYIDLIIYSKSPNGIIPSEYLGKLKDAFGKQIIEKQAYDLLYVYPLLQSAYNINTAASSLENIDAIDIYIDNNNHTTSHPSSSSSSTSNVVNVSESKIKRIIEECWPCEQRLYWIKKTFGMPFNAEGRKYYDMYFTQMWRTYLMELRNILSIKLGLFDYGLLSTLCAAGRMLLSYVCIPDLNSIASLLKTRLQALDKELSEDFSFAFGDILETSISYSIKFVASRMRDLLFQHMQLITGAVDCTLLALREQMRKLKFLSEDVYKNIASFTDTVLESERWLYDRIDTLFNELDKINLQSYLMNVEIYRKISTAKKTSLHLGFLAKLIAGFIYARNALSSKHVNNLTTLIDAICRAAVAEAYPWIIFNPPYTGPKGGPQDQGDTQGGSDTTEDDTGGSGGGGKDGSDETSIPVQDPTIPNGIFDGGIHDLLNDDRYKKFFDKYKLIKSLENGIIDLTIDDVVKLQLNSLKDNIITDAGKESFAITYNSCMYSGGKSFFTSDNIQEILDRLKKN